MDEEEEDTEFQKRGLFFKYEGGLIFSETKYEET